MQNINLTNKTILITGAAGFIGATLVMNLLNRFENIRIIGIDNLNDYYDVSLKEYRLSQIHSLSDSGAVSGVFQFVKADISDKSVIEVLFQIYQPDLVVNLAAQAGVRYSITNPDAYISSNLDGFYHILVACRHSYDNGS